MSKRTVYLEKVDAGPAHAGRQDAPLKAYWQGTLDGCTVTYSTGIVGRGARPPVGRTLATAGEALQTFEAHLAAQRKKGFEEPAGAPPKSKKRAAPAGAPAVLRFHKKLFASLGVSAQVSAEARAVVAERERACGVAFPPSVKEWFSLAGVFELFRQHTNEDELITNERGDDAWRLARLGDPRDTAQGYLRVAVENQAVVGWYVKLDGTADPPVFQNDDDWDSPLSEVKWVACADRFSEFLRDMMLEH